MTPNNAEISAPVDAGTFFFHRIEKKKFRFANFKPKVRLPTPPGCTASPASTTHLLTTTFASFANIRAEMLDANKPTKSDLNT